VLEPVLCSLKSFCASGCVLWVISFPHDTLNKIQIKSSVLKDTVLYLESV